MPAFDPNKYLTLTELLASVEAARRAYEPLKGLEAVPDRTVRFYAEQGLLPNVARGRGKKYPADFVWKVLFIRILTQVHQLKLAHVAAAMRKVDVETMRRVVTGEEPLEFASTADAGAVARHAAKGHRVVALEPSSAAVKEEDPATYDGWETLVSGPNVLFKMGAGVPAANRKALRLIGQLIEGLLEESHVVRE